MATPDRDPRCLILDRSPRLGDLSEEARDTLALNAEIVELEPGSSLVREGEKADVLYVIDCGLLEARVERPDGSPERVGWFTRGDLIGEMSLLTERPRSATVSVVRHVVALSIPFGICRDCLFGSQASMKAIASLLIDRSQERNRQPRPGPLVVATLMADDVDPPILASLKDACTEREATELLAAEQAADHLESDVHSKGCSRELARWLDERECDRRLVVLAVEPSDGPWQSIAISRADVLLVFGNAGDVEPPSPIAGQRVDRVVLSPTGEGDVTPSKNGERTHILIDRDARGLRRLLDQIDDDFSGIERLRAFELLRDLRDDQLALLLEDIEWNTVQGGTVLAKEGERVDHVFLIEAGRVRVFNDKDPEGEQTIRDLGAGETVGELAGLTEGPRTASVRAIRDSTVATIRSDRFRAMIDEIPSTGGRLARALAHRLISPPDERHHAVPRGLALLCLPNVSTQVVSSIESAFESLGSRVCCVDADRVDRRFGSGASALPTTAPGQHDLVHWLHTLEADHDHLLFVCDGSNAAWAERCRRHADRLVVLTDASSPGTVQTIERQWLDRTAELCPIHLVLLQPAGIEEASGTARFLDLRPTVTHHHVRQGNSEDYQRLARHLSDRAVAVALSGASSRGPAHFGVIRAMEEMGLPVDLITGSSSGAAMAALQMMPLGYEERFARALTLMAGIGFRFRDLQPPFTALMSGRLLGRQLRAVYEDHRVEDQITPGFVTAVDLRRRRLVRIRTGPIWLAVRASLSIPILWPPVWRNEDLLIDGGILSYMPIDELLDVCAGGLAIASDLDINAGTSRPSFSGYKDYGDALSGWSTLRQRLNPFTKRDKVPSLMRLLFHVMFLPSFYHQRRIRQLTERPFVRFVRPQVTHTGVFTVSEAQVREYESLAYEEAKRVLGDARELAPSSFG